jgi:copper homeostasis protein CutC
MVHVEVCVTSVAEAQAAARCGADSIELCAWLASGGITPSAGTIATVERTVHLPLRVLVRPVTGGFAYAPVDREVLLADAVRLAQDLDAPRLVTGGWLDDGGADHAPLRAIRRMRPTAEVTFHRAIDEHPDLLGVLDACIDAGYDRVLTSGGAARAVEGLAMLKAMVRRAEGKLRIAAAGRIDPGNVLRIIESTGVQEVHFAAQRILDTDRPFDVVPDEAKVEGVLNALVKAGLR